MRSKFLITSEKDQVREKIIERVSRVSESHAKNANGQYGQNGQNGQEIFKECQRARVSRRFCKGERLWVIVGMMYRE